ncbi:hypothetical protein [Photobacterium profundum]|uniref:hypothetical protein n=1 Tax=Photobacterium profundum TaxID=74109 RepID=UPI000057B72F|nr:hypothetical protein [Photobacterium profundum]
MKDKNVNHDQQTPAKTTLVNEKALLWRLIKAFIKIGMFLWRVYKLLNNDEI